MLKLIAPIAVVAALALPLPVIAQTMAPGASTVQHPQAHRRTGSYNSQMRHRSNMSRERARAGAEHVRNMHIQ